MSDPRRIVRTEPGQSTTGDDDVLVDDCGEKWRRVFYGYNPCGTAPERRAKVIDGWVIPE